MLTKQIRLIVKLTFFFQSNLILHKATHNNNDPRCPECNKKFSRIASLKAHVMLHEKEESLFCSECGDEFSTMVGISASLYNTSVYSFSYLCFIKVNSFFFFLIFVLMP